MGGEHIDDLIVWLRRYFVVCAAVYFAAALVGTWWATRSKSQRIWPLLAIVLAAYFASIPFHWSFTNDDSYIFYRYAENLSAGGGYVYNVGVACEGFTSPA